MKNFIEDFTLKHGIHTQDFIHIIYQNKRALDV